MWDLRVAARDSPGEGRDPRGPHLGARVSIGLIALWVGWPGGLALYACGRSVRVLRRGELTPARGTRSRDRS